VAAILPPKWSAMAILSGHPNIRIASAPDERFLVSIKQANLQSSMLQMNTIPPLDPPESISP
jgi:hypothetical protein